MNGTAIRNALADATCANVVAHVRGSRRYIARDNSHDLAHILSHPINIAVDDPRPRGQDVGAVPCRTPHSEDFLMVCHAADPRKILETTFLEAHVAAIARCARIAELLFEFPTSDRDVAITWDHVVELGQTNRRLQAVVQFLERPTGEVPA